MGGFTRSLKAAHHNHCGSLGGGIDALLPAPHKGGKLLVNYLDHRLGGGKTFGYILADGLFGHRVCKVLCNLIVDVGLKKGKSDLAHCLLDIAFGQLSAAFYVFKGICKFFG